MERNKIALQLYSVREDLQKDFFGTLKRVKQMGYSGAEFAGLYDYDPVEVKKVCEELGLEVVSAHVPFTDLLENWDNTIDCYEKLGCKRIVIPYLNEEHRPGNPGFLTVMESVQSFGEKLAKRGMTLQYHNHDFEFTKIDGTYALDRLYATASPEQLQTQLDTCWVKVAGEDPVEYIHKYAGRMPTIHLKDYAGQRTENMYALIGIDDDKEQEASDVFEFRPLGHGLQDIPAIVAAATAGGAEWFIVEQDLPSMGYNAMECAKISVDYLLNEVLD